MIFILSPSFSLQRPIVEFALEDSRALKLMKKKQQKQVMQSENEGKKMG